MTQWKTIVIEDQKTNYEVSTSGEVRNIKTNKILKGTILRNEYRTVQLTINDKPKSKMVHRLVAETFIPNPNNYNIVDHIDRNKHNNNIDNLRWVDSQTNAKNKEKVEQQKTRFFFQGDIEELKPLLINSNYGADDKGNIINYKTKRILQGSCRNGYIRFFIREHHYSAHHLVWEAFNGPIPKGMVIDHIDGNKSNNAISNLRLVSQSENIYHNTEISKGTAKKVYQYTLDGQFVKEYNSLTEAGQNIKATKEAIGQAIKREGSCGGYLWLTDTSDVLIEDLVAKNKKPRADACGVTQYDIHKNKIAHYDSLKIAAAAANCSSSTISRGAKAKRLAKGFYWILDNSNITINDL